MYNQNKKKWFTLVELIISIVIIWLLAVALIPKIQSTQWRTRDTKRINDIRQLSVWIFSYYNDNWYYPNGGNVWDGGRAVSTQPNFLSSLQHYLTEIPKDPKNIDNPWVFYSLKASSPSEKDYYYVYYAYPADSAWTNAWCSFANNSFAVIGAVTMEWWDKAYNKITAWCSWWRTRNDEIDYPYAIQSKWQFY